MGVWDETSLFPSLTSDLGELLSVRIAIPWRELENLLETLSEAPFPINPEIRHGSPLTAVEFPAYSQQIEEIRRAVQNAGWDAREIETRKLWPELVGGAC